MDYKFLNAEGMTDYFPGVSPRSAMEIHRIDIMVEKLRNKKFEPGTGDIIACEYMVM